MERVSNIEKNVFIREMIEEIQISKTTPNIKVLCHDENIVNIDFSILEILQSHLR